MTPRLPRPAKPVRRKSERRQARGGQAFRQGHAAEWMAALVLLLKGYRILGFRLRTRLGEIDILACKRRVLVVVEVKRRRTMAAALTALTTMQRDRLYAAGEFIQRNHPRLQMLALRVDLIAMSGMNLPRHVRGTGFTGASARTRL